MSKIYVWLFYYNINNRPTIARVSYPLPAGCPLPGVTINV